MRAFMNNLTRKGITWARVWKTRPPVTNSDLPQTFNAQNSLLSLRFISSGFMHSKSTYNQHSSRHSELNRQWIYCIQFGRRNASQHAYRNINVKKSRKTFYDILEVHPLATQMEIKTAYYELSMKYHPDVSCSVEAREQFTGTIKFN